MRVAIFSGNYNYLREGANQALNRLARHLESSGHIVRAYSPVTDTPAFEPAGTLVPVPSIALPGRSEFRLALGLPRRVQADLLGFAPDIIHVSTPDILDTRAQTLARRLGIPIVASQHTLFETYPEYYGFGWARPMVETHLRRFYRRADHVLAPTPVLVEDMKALRGDDRASLWSRGVDRDVFNPARRDEAWRRSQGIAPHEIAILFFGRLVLEKGVRAFASIVRALQGRGLRVRPLIVGAGPAAAEIESLPGVIMAGHLEGADLATAVASADLFLHLSTTETFGNVLLEAMAAGLPIVSADAPNARLLIRDGENGLLCPPGDLGAFEEAVRLLIDEPGHRRRLAAKARAASEAYSWEAASESVVEAYRGLLRARAAARPCNDALSA